MSEMQIRRWVMLVFFFNCVKLVVGQDQAGRYDILKGTNGESSCQLRDTVHSTCNEAIAPPPLNVTPIPSLCTCNKVYFNIWSACSYATGNNTLPVYAQWTGTCTSNSINLAESASLPSFSRGLGIDIPVWGSMDVPGNTSFDIQQAVVLVHLAPKPWTIFQIVLPIITTVITILLTLFSLYIYRRKLANLEWRDEVVHLFHHVPKVKSVDLPTVDDDWQIEQPVSNFIPPPRPKPSPMIDPLSLVDTNRDTIPGNPSVPSTGYGDSNLATVGTGSSGVPGGRVYPFSPPFQQQSNLKPSKSDPNSTNSSSSGRGWRIPSSSTLRGMHIPVPWRRRPVPIREVQPRSGFRLDERDLSTVASSSAGTQSSFTSWGPERPRGSFEVRRHEDRQDEGIEEPIEGGDQGFEDEGTNLITDEERRTNSVIDIRNRNGGVERSTMRSSQPSSFTHDSSIDSHVRIVPPSNSSSSPRSTMVTSRIYSGVPAPPPPVPPVPNQPAPLPPSPNRRFPRAGNNTIERSAFNPPLIPPNRFMSPIQEIDRFSDINLSERRTPSPVHSFASSNRAEQISRPGPAAVNGRKLSSENPRPLPAPSNASGPSPPDYLNTHQRSASDSISRSASSGSVYEDDFQNGTGGPGHARSRSASADSQAPPPRHGVPVPGSPRPLPSTFANSSSPGPSLPYYHHTPQRSASGSTSSLANQVFSADDLYTDPFAAAAAHGRGLEMDDTASFYLTSPDPLQPVRSASPLSMQGDPGMLFPASVRGAGYRGTPS